MSKMNKCLGKIFLLVSLMSSESVFAAAQQVQPSLGEALTHMLPMFVIFIGVFYFLLIRPQNKKNREHKALVNNIKVGDEVTTIGGIIASVSTITEQYAVLSLNNGNQIILQRSSIASVLPKGTISTIK